jgi:hypothetical protein
MKSKAIQARDAVIQRLPSWEQIIRGTLMSYWRTCGNRGCRCYRGKRYRHGPYLYLAVSWAGKRQKLYAIDPSKAEEIRRGVAAYRKIWKGLYRIAELNLEIIKSTKRREEG